MAKGKKTEDHFVAGEPEAAGKMFYQIREVSEMTGIKPHVLRYWETEFPSLRPEKGSTGQRIYRAKDLELIRRIKTLLYNDKFTIAGAKRKLASESRPEKVSEKLQMDLRLGLRENQLLNTILKVKNELQLLLQMLNRPAKSG